MVLVHLLLASVLVTGGVAAGVLVATVVGIAPMMLAVGYQRYVETVQFLRPRFDPLMPVLNAVTVLACVGLAVAAPGMAVRTGFAAAGVLSAGTMAISILRNVPVNRYVMGLDPDREPADWPAVDPRRRWRTWNLVRAALAVLAFVVNAATAALLA